MKAYDPLNNHQRDWLCDVAKLDGKPPFAYIWNPVYGFGFIFTWDTDEKHFNQVVRRYSSKPPKRKIFVPQRGGKFVTTGGESDIFIGVTKMRTQVDQIETLAHEAYHLIDDIVRDGRGLRCKEAMAYAVGWAIGRMIHMMELYKFRKNSLKRSCIRCAKRHASKPNRKKL